MFESSPTVTVQFRTYPIEAKDWRERIEGAQDVCCDLWQGQAKKRLRFAGTQGGVISHAEEIYQSIVNLLKNETVDTDHFRIQLMRVIE